MAGYAIQTRIDGVRPRVTALARQPVAAARPRRLVLDGDPLQCDAPIVAEERGTTTTPDRWERLREVWAQTTFFLFSGDSWR
jgi:hypothetical protein